MRTALKAWLFATCAIAGFGCTGGEKNQVLTGRVSTRGAIAVRAIDGNTVITAGRVRSDGSFTLSLPAGHHYRLEVLSAAGVHNVVGRKGGTLADVAFSVCDPQPPWDMGGFGEPGCDPMTDPNCGGDSGGGGTCDPNDPNCKPWPCDPMTDPMCVPPCDPAADGTCQPPCDPNSDPNCVPPPPPCDPMDPMCKCYPGDPNCPTPCDPMTDPNCGGGGGGGTCDPMTDPNCGGMCDPSDPNCKPWPCDLDANGNCQPPCDPMTDPMCPTPPPPCTDPTDPNTCKDPCMVDPIACGCGTDGNGTVTTMPDGSTDNTCWPPPEPCTMESCPEDPWSPEHPPGDFGCGDAGGGTPVSDGTVMPGWDGMK